MRRFHNKGKKQAIGMLSDVLCGALCQPPVESIVRCYGRDRARTAATEEGGRAGERSNLVGEAAAGTGGGSGARWLAREAETEVVKLLHWPLTVVDEGPRRWRAPGRRWSSCSGQRR